MAKSAAQSFFATTRVQGKSLVVTIPAKKVRAWRLKPGETVLVEVYKASLR